MNKSLLLSALVSLGCAASPPPPSGAPVARTNEAPVDRAGKVMGVVVIPTYRTGVADGDLEARASGDPADESALPGLRVSRRGLHPIADDHPQHFVRIHVYGFDGGLSRWSTVMPAFNGPMSLGSDAPAMDFAITVPGRCWGPASLMTALHLPEPPSTILQWGLSGDAAEGLSLRDPLAC